MNTDTSVHFVRALYKRHHMQHRSDLYQANEKNTHPEKLTLNFRHKYIMLNCL